ncbi:MAG: NAD(+)/NADH kinase [Coriobacteriales bacterium]|jgi:NAD+ kinase|nr:NAD(+)/NADH kinase [Coriobacteriales bacterium]
MRFLLICNNDYAAAKDALYEAKIWLEQRENSTHVLTIDKISVGTTALKKAQKKVAGYDVVCAFGGDGTILRAAHVVADSGVPLLGINFGNLGFLAGATKDVVIPALESILAGECAREARVLLDAVVVYESQIETKLFRYFALNEVMVGRSDLGRSVKLDLAVNGETICKIAGDGALIATATGSTAYSLSAGGPIVSPRLGSLIVSPVAPHSLNARSIVTAAGDVVELFPHTLFANELVIHVDGQQLPYQESWGRATSIKIVRAANELTLLRYNAPDFYQRVSDEFFSSGR